MTSACSHCDAHNAPYRCGTCGDASYCNAKCQQQDWQLHTKFCELKIDDYNEADKNALVLFVYASTQKIEPTDDNQERLEQID
jgi:hypothetical protein